MFETGPKPASVHVENDVCNELRTAVCKTILAVRCALRLFSLMRHTETVKAKFQ